MKAAGCMLTATLLLAASYAPAEEYVNNTLVSLECERLSLLVGGAFEYPSTVQLSAKVIPGRAGVEVRFTVSGEAIELTLEGKLKVSFLKDLIHQFLFRK